MKNKKHPTTQEKKNKAIEFMKQLNIFAPLHSRLSRE
jgi:hypothetical protein